MFYLEYIKSLFVYINSVCSFISLVSCDYLSFAFSSRCLVAITWLSQSSFDRFFLCYQSLSGTLTSNLLDHLLHVIIGHWKLVVTGM